METLVKSLVKWLFTIILPSVVTIFIATLYIWNGWLGWSSFVVWLSVLVVVWLNALLYTAMMRSTSLLPKVSVNRVPVCGFAMGIDRVSAKNFSYIILFPFFTVEFTPRKSKKKGFSKA